MAVLKWSPEIVLRHLLNKTQEGSIHGTNAWCQFSEDGAYVSWYYGGTTLGRVIRTSDNSVAASGWGMNTIFKRNGEYYVFRNYNIYTFSGTKLTNYTSSDYGFTYTYCFWTNDTLVLFGSTNKYILTFNEDWEFQIVSTTSGTINPTSYSWKQCKLGYPKYWKNGLMFEPTTQGTTLKITTKNIGKLSSLTRNSIVYRNTSGIDLTPNMVLNNHTFINAEGEYTGTLTFTDFAEYTQCLGITENILG